MYKFGITTNADKINEFNLKDKKGHIFQTSYWSQIKKDWQTVFIEGTDSENKIVLSSMMLIRKIPYIKKFIGYIPRGFVCDYSNEILVKEFTEYLKNYCKENSIAFATIDPDIHLRENGYLLENGEKTKNILKSLGYISSKAAGKNFEGIQPNFVFRLNLKNNIVKEDRKQAVFEGFDKKWQYNITLAKQRGLTCEVYDKNSITEEVLQKFQDIMVTTGKRDNFIVRPKSYFKDMIDSLYPYCKIYMIKYNPDKDIERLNEKINKTSSEIERLNIKLEQFKVKIEDEKDDKKLKSLTKKYLDTTSAIKREKEVLEKHSSKLNEIKVYEGKNDIYISGSVFLYYGNKSWYLYGASDNLLRDAMPNFLMQWSMIEDSIDLGIETYDFRGVSGDLDENNPLFGLYKFKKGFGGDFVEFIGEFDIVNNKLLYSSFKHIFPKFKEIRLKIMNNK